MKCYLLWIIRSITLFGMMLACLDVKTDLVPAFDTDSSHQIAAENRVNYWVKMKRIRAMVYNWDHVYKSLLLFVSGYFWNRPWYVLTSYAYTQWLTGGTAGVTTVKTAGLRSLHLIWTTAVVLAKCSTCWGNKFYNQKTVWKDSWNKGKVGTTI